MNDCVDAFLSVAAALGIIDGQNAITGDAGNGPIADFEIMAVAAKQLPAELTAHAETADVASHLKFIPRRDLMAKTQSDDWVDPLHVAGFCQCNPYAALETQCRQIDNASDGKRQSIRNIPISKAAICVDGGERVAARSVSTTMRQPALEFRLSFVPFFPVFGLAD